MIAENIGDGFVSFPAGFLLRLTWRAEIQKRQRSHRTKDVGHQWDCGVENPQLPKFAEFVLAIVEKIAAKFRSKAATTARRGTTGGPGGGPLESLLEVTAGSIWSFSTRAYTSAEDAPEEPWSATGVVDPGRTLMALDD